MDEIIAECNKAADRYMYGLSDAVTSDFYFNADLTRSAFEAGYMAAAIDALYGADSNGS